MTFFFLTPEHCRGAQSACTKLCYLVLDLVHPQDNPDYDTKDCLKNFLDSVSVSFQHFFGPNNQKYDSLSCRFLLRVRVAKILKYFEPKNRFNCSYDRNCSGEGAESKEKQRVNEGYKHGSSQLKAPSAEIPSPPLSSRFSPSGNGRYCNILEFGAFTPTPSLYPRTG